MAIFDSSDVALNLGTALNMNNLMSEINALRNQQQPSAQSAEASSPVVQNGQLLLDSPYALPAQADSGSSVATAAGAPAMDQLASGEAAKPLPPLPNQYYEQNGDTIDPRADVFVPELPSDAPINDMVQKPLDSVGTTIMQDMGQYFTSNDPRLLDPNAPIWSDQTNPPEYIPEPNDSVMQIPNYNPADGPAGNSAMPYSAITVGLSRIGPLTGDVPPDAPGTQSPEAPGPTPPAAPPEVPSAGSSTNSSPPADALPPQMALDGLGNPIPLPPGLDTSGMTGMEKNWIAIAYKNQQQDQSAGSSTNGSAPADAPPATTAPADAGAGPAANIPGDAGSGSPPPDAPPAAPPEAPPVDAPSPDPPADIPSAPSFDAGFGLEGGGGGGGGDGSVLEDFD